MTRKIMVLTDLIDNEGNQDIKRVSNEKVLYMYFLYLARTQPHS